MEDIIQKTMYKKSMEIKLHNSSVKAFEAKVKEYNKYYSYETALRMALDELSDSNR